MSEALLIDSTAEDATNVQVDLFAYPFAVTAIRTPTPPSQPRWATPDDADGDALVASRYQNREITISLEIVPTETTAAARAATAEAALASLADKVTKVNREAGTLRRTMPSGKVLTFDLLAADSLDPSWDIEWDVGNILRFDLHFTAKPFWRGVEISGTTDSFAANTIADYTLTGTGVAISGGGLSVSSTAAKTLLHNARRFIDGTVTLKFTTGASVTTWVQQIIGKAVDASNHLCVQMTQAGAIAIVKTVRGTPTTLASTAGANLSTATSYWLRLVMCSNVVTGELWTTDPTLGGSPSRTVTWTLAGADITTYGEGVSGLVGFGMTPGGTDWTYDDYSALWRTQERGLPVLTLTTPGAPGDAPALGRLVVSDAQGVDQRWLVWGLQAATYSAASTAALFYEAEALTPMGTAAIATVSGASGGGTNNVVTEGTLTPRWAAVLSTQARGGGAHLTHDGSYRMFARIYRPASNTGAVAAAAEWSAGDFRSLTRNRATYYGADGGGFTIVDLGIVDSPASTSRWAARIIAQSTVTGDDLGIDCLWLMPVDASGEVQAVWDLSSPAVFSAHDEFDQSSGALTGKSLPNGGTWSGAGDTDDFLVDTTLRAAKRSANSDSGTSPLVGRAALAGGTAGMTDQVASVDFRISIIPKVPNLVTSGLLLRYVDSGNYFVVYFSLDSSAIRLAAALVVARTTTVLPLDGSSSSDISGISPVGVFRRLTVGINAAGMVNVTLGTGDAIVETFGGQSAVLATGGTLARGSAGIYDMSAALDSELRCFDNFAAWAPGVDAAIYANRSVDIGYARVARQTSDGTDWVDAPKAPGDRFYVPCAGPDQRTLRLAAKASRFVPGDGPDAAIDDLTGQLYVTPRGLIAS